MMNQFMLAHCAGRPGGELLDECLKQLGSIPPEANFGFLYLSDHLSEQADSILIRLKQETDISNWVGSIGIAILASDHEYYDQTAMAIMLASFNEADFQVLPNLTSGTSALPSEIADWCQTNDFTVGLLHADPSSATTQTQLAVLEETIPTAFMVGGITSSRAQNFQFANKTLQGGLSGVLFSQAVPIKTNLSQGCTPIGKRHIVTHCDNNIIHNLDDRPALDVLADDVGEVISQDWQQLSGYIFAGIVNKSSDQDDYSIRQIVGIDVDEKLVGIGDYLQHNDEIIFCRRDGNSAMEDLERMLFEFKARLKTPIKGGIYVSCLGRGRQQFGDDSQEIRFIHSVLGDFPMVGFFANGEIHKNTLYGFTGVLTLFV